jgi:hypothetical protein
VETTTECLPSPETTLSTTANLTDFLVLLPLMHLAQSCLTHRPLQRPDDSVKDDSCFRAAASRPRDGNPGNPTTS